MALPISATEWTETHVKQWLIQCGFGSYAHLLCDIHKINGTALLMLTEKDLRSPPLSIEVNCQCITNFKIFFCYHIKSYAFYVILLNVLC